MAAKIKVPRYLLPDNITIDPESDEVYIVQSARDDTDDITRRVSRNTFSSESKLYPWDKKNEKIWRKAIVVNKNPTFECVTPSKALSITERVSRPTKSSVIRQNEENSRPSTRESTGSNRSSNYRMRLWLHPFDLTKPVPRASARPERPILRTPSRQKSRGLKSGESGETKRNVRFQSPLPPMLTRSTSRTSFVSSLQSTSEDDIGHIIAQRKQTLQSDSESDVTSVQQTNEASSYAANEETKEHSDDEEVHKENADASLNRTRSPEKLNESKSKKKKKTPSKDGGNPNMEMVLNYFSKLPPSGKEENKVKGHQGQKDQPVQKGHQGQEESNDEEQNKENANSDKNSNNNPSVDPDDSLNESSSKINENASPRLNESSSSRLNESSSSSSEKKNKLNDSKNKKKSKTSAKTDTKNMEMVLNFFSKLPPV